MSTDQGSVDGRAGGAEYFFEDAPCGYVVTGLDGRIVRVNRTFEAWTGLRREDLVSSVRFEELLSRGGRIFYETHCSPLLRMAGEVREVALDIVRGDGSVLTALVNSAVRGAGESAVITTTVFDATERRRYEQELLAGRRREQEIARELQLSMLSGELPGGSGVEVGVTYRPGERGLEIGGDWYDAFWLVEGQTVGLVVGDVVGRGVGAAAAMGQLRSAVRALASTGLGPGRLLDGLDDYARRHRVGRMATVVYAELDVGSGELAYACAGHLPPVIAEPDRAPGFAWEGRSPPLDAHLKGSGRRPDAAVRLAVGSTILLYTDGLVERRTAPVNEGMDRLLGVVAATRRADPATLASGVVRGLHTPGHDDDVCVLAARLTIPDQPV
ncbi:MAG TPA: SpoIIE family protein phosphatase [Solirubrobacteraceae bacterium]|nr:SpoIIE family protein phosphatase [Solirubrobacteraceae bacterium]